MIYTQTKCEEKKRTLCVSKVNFYTQKMKNHLPGVNLNFFITTPNLTSNFETGLLPIFGQFLALKPLIFGKWFQKN